MKYQSQMIGLQNRRSFLRGTILAGAGLTLATTNTITQPAQAATSLTGVQNFTNNIGFTIDFQNTENTVNNRQIANNTTASVSNAWVPWCDTADDFADHHFRIYNSDQNTTLVQIWQQGDYVRFSYLDEGWKASSSSNELIGISQSINLTLSGSASDPKIKAVVTS